ncbi:hypothetical protein DN062_13615 [Nitrincola tibetensis]|uniref:Endonuclease/exonuclease/phosphatase domain-containing protein n=1 Tax=Nitrincola tibetensis TaxID=2219697 RepID=A0A364NJY7_9GAMM|nr:endonuclease/exonuclease/phosphatase family protein [Nitrincola tibetensis]RAU17205.1 hypothetical protein DN062_13615 [Nitrincola tibetensis]
MTQTPFRLLTWNIQSGKGCDGQIALDHVINYIFDQGPLTVICLQEVARYFDEYVCSTQPDQLAVLCQAFSEYTPVWGAALSWPGSQPNQRREFGNLTLVNAPMLDKRVHSLPSSSATEYWQTPRCAVETLIAGHQPIRILNTHLAYHNPEERFVQLAYLNDLAAKYTQENRLPRSRGPGIYAHPDSTNSTLLCGDLNLDSTSDQYHWLRQQGWKDAFQQCYPKQIPFPTCGVYDSDQWPQGPHCRDYILLQNLKAHTFSVDTHTPLSDHQPLIVTLETSVHDTP